MTEHYFTAEPASAADLRTRSVVLAGESREVTVASGIFSPDGVDRGTAVLLAEAAPPPPGGTFLDLGCGWGPIALTLALTSPDATVWAVDVNERALDLVRRNAAALGLGNVVVARPDEVPAGTRFELIWSNPPIRIGKAALHELLNRWLPMIAAGGRAELVVAKQLGADSLQRWIGEQLPPPEWAVTRPATAKGFRILRVDSLRES